VWSTEIFLSLPERPGRKWLYVALTALAALTQPYALFVTAAHAFFGRVPIAAIAVSALALGPWYAHFRADWSGVGTQQLAAFDPKSLLVLAHEISGSGYVGTGILLAGIVPAVHRPQWVWLACVAIPLVGVFAANAALHYFFATRQLIFILPALALLFTKGANRLLIAAFLAASLYEDVQWFRKPRENWQAAADAIQREVSQGACVKFQGDSTPVYEFFYPSFAQRHCAGTESYTVTGSSVYETLGLTGTVRG
jgi:hypothetical protein